MFWHLGRVDLARMLGRPGRLRSQRDAVHRNVLGEVLRALLAQILEADRELGMDLIVYLLGDQDAARFGHGLKPCGEINALTQKVVSIDHHIAQMDADSKAQRAFLVGAVAAEFALHLDCALDGLDDRGEFRDQTVAGCIDNPAVVTID